MKVKVSHYPIRGHYPDPQSGESPTAYADRIGQGCVDQISNKQRKAHGIFFTPPEVANFMARQILASRNNIRLLDPAAGVGMLCCAAVETLVLNRRPCRIELIAHETEQSLTAPLRAVLDYLVHWCRIQHNATVRAEIKTTDFILANAGCVRQQQIFPVLESEKFDIVIANPPYFKLRKSDLRAAAMPDVVHGQPNIYALFMALSAKLLRVGGRFVFITPRSFASGRYFRRFRTVFFAMLQPTHVHVFDSRHDAFRRDAVLQENVILSGVRQDQWHKRNVRPMLTITSSLGTGDMDDAGKRKIPASDALDMDSLDKILRLPISAADDAALALIDSWPNNLMKLDLNASTGPIVPFRATEWIDRSGQFPKHHAPFLWPEHLRPMEATWPLKGRKAEYIKRAGAKRLLVPNRNYVLIRRFSTKEDVSRLTAAPWIANKHPTVDIGFENQLNYVHRPGGSLSENEAWGLAALYNSRLLDRWFRTLNGNTHVSATELRAMPLPSHERIVALGQWAKEQVNPIIELDAFVERTTELVVMG